MGRFVELLSPKGLCWCVCIYIYIYTCVIYTRSQTALITLGRSICDIATLSLWAGMFRSDVRIAEVYRFEGFGAFGTEPLLATPF